MGISENGCEYDCYHIRKLFLGINTGNYTLMEDTQIPSFGCIMYFLNVNLQSSVLSISE